MLRTLVLLSLLTLTAISGVARAADKPAAFTDPAKAGADYEVQGEYVGIVATEEGPQRYGAQIIALGDGKFRGVGYHGGLPGAGWNKSERLTIDGETKDGVTTFATPDSKATLKDGVIKILGDDGQERGTLTKVTRHSTTVGAKPPEGAVVLFDGKSADAFKGGRMTDDGLLMEGVTSKQLFQSFTIHLEFQTPFMPAARGQGRGNSGFYAQGRYEVQILDSFGLEGENNECGGIYTIAKPAFNACLPPLAWQTYDIDFTAAEYKDGEKVKNARITVRHNGSVIHEDVELPKSTTAAPVQEGPDAGPIYLQNHGNPVRFRNIWVVEKK
jgi:hypothetical protein